MKKTFFTGFAVSIITSVFSQNWQEMMYTENNFYKIKKTFYEQYEGKETETGGENSYELFKRWESFVEPRVYPTGDLSLLGLTPKNFGEFLLNNSGQQKMNGGNFISSTTWQAAGPIGALTTSLMTGYFADGRIDFLKIDPNNPNTLYAGTPSGGFWKSTNGGTTWATTTDNLAVIGCADVAVDPTNSNIIYLATGDGVSWYNQSVGILKSTNGGSTWNQTGLTFTIQSNVKITSIIINKSNPNILLAGVNAGGSNDGIYRSTNAGATWTQVLNSVFINDLKYKTNDTSIIYAAGLQAFYRSTNGGLTFTQITNGIPTSGFNGMKIAVTSADSNYVYLIGVNTSGDYKGFYRSTNGGAAFTASTNTLNITGYVITQPGGQGNYDLCIGASPLNKNDVTIGGIYPYRSTDGGNTWAKIMVSGNSTHGDIHCITYDAAGDIYIGDDGGVCLYSGGNFLNKCGNMNISQIYRIGLSALTPNLWITSMQDIGSNIWNGSTYLLSEFGDGADCFFDRTNNNTVFCSQVTGKFEKSTVGGAFLNWNNCTSGMSGSAPWLAPWKQDPLIANKLYGGYTDLFVSNNLAGSWTTLTPLPNGGVPISDFVIAPSNNQVIYVMKQNGIYKSTNAGIAWTTITGTIPVSSAGLTDICVSSSDPNRVWVTMSGYFSGNKVFATTDGGNTWTNISNNLPNIPANCILYAGGFNNRIYIGMDVGVYYFDDQSGTWTLYNNGLPNVIIYELESTPANPGKIYAATHGRGVYVVDEASGTLGIQQLGVGSSELGVYPNPNKGNFTIDVQGETQLILYNALGNIVLNKKIKTGKTNIDMSPFSDGIYYLKAVSGYKTETMKVLKEN